MTCPSCEMGATSEPILGLGFTTVNEELSDMLQLVVTQPTEHEALTGSLDNQGLGWLRHDKLKHIGRYSIDFKNSATPARSPYSAHPSGVALNQFTSQLAPSPGKLTEPHGPSPQRVGRDSLD